MDRELIRIEAQKELARRSFWEYCKLMAPDFYKEERSYLVDMCERFQNFYEDSEKKILVINVPPRHGKSRTASLFTQWILGRNPKEKVMTGSYNEMLSTTFARSVRDVIMTEKSPGVVVYNDIFPKTNVKRGEASANKWSLEGSSVASYLATSPGGTATGFGASLMIIDDLIKNAEEAFNETVLQRHIDWFTNTMLSRTENGFKLIIIMTRWATNDLAGFILNNYNSVEHISYKAVQDDGTMLCDDVLSKEDFDLKTKFMDKSIVYANYQQEPIDIKGRLYSDFKTYDTVPADASGKPLFSQIKAYVDTADTGSDNLCAICYGVYEKKAYILDILYTKDPMEVTEGGTVKILTKNNVGVAKIESNNGGRGFARNVQEKLKKGGNSFTKVTWFHQSQNKQARILSNSAAVVENVLFPVDWKNRFPEFAQDILKYQREGKNAHDDAPDALTGVIENLDLNTGWF